MNTATRSDELRAINRQLAELRSFMQVNDIVNRKEALQILDITPKVLTNYICQNKVQVVSRNKAGQCFFSRMQLLGLK